MFSSLPYKFFNIQLIGALPLQLNSFYYSAKQLYRIACVSGDLNQTNSDFDKVSAKLIPSVTAENIFNEYLVSTVLHDFLKRVDISSDSGERNFSGRKKALTLNFSSDEENYNFDTGFISLLSIILNQEKDSLPYIFKTKTDDYKVRLFIYSDQPEADDFVKMISSETTEDIYTLIPKTENPNISLKEFVDMQRTLTN